MVVSLISYCQIFQVLDECPPEVSVTFDSSMKYLPKGARPMSERVDELTAELAANEMVDLVEAEEHLQRKKRLLSTK